jgi:hypothetical protein
MPLQDWGSPTPNKPKNKKSVNFNLDVLVYPRVEQDIINTL